MQDQSKNVSIYGLSSYLNKLLTNATCSYLNSHGITDVNILKGLVKHTDIQTTKYSDFTYTGMLRIFQIHKNHFPDDKTLNLCLLSESIIKFIMTNDSTQLIKKMEQSRNYINISINNVLLEKLVWKYGIMIIKDGLKLTHFDNLLNNISGKISIITKTENNNKKNIIIDYSSPNVAKSLHIGHLRSTIIGESLVRLLQTSGHCVQGINHIGDWGTQFGMIINYLKTTYKTKIPIFEQKSELSVTEVAERSMIDIYIKPPPLPTLESVSESASEFAFGKYDEKIIMDIIIQADSNKLMEIYRNAKKLFDIKKDSDFAKNSRNETFLLQQGDAFNQMIWKEICKISSNEYLEIYKMLNVHNLIECGESFYQSMIPGIIDKLIKKNLIKEDEGKKIIMLDHWTYPLIVVKSDGAYTYDTTDLAALYYRLSVLQSDHVIYITDSGQESHFKMCFEIAEIMGWSLLKNLSHIGFGLVCGKDGKKLKTRSGDVVKMLDVITDVIEKSKLIIQERSMSDNSMSIYYKNMSENDFDQLSRRIGINTLKYFDLSHSYASNYKYDPDLMFRFNGDTGVYLMYCYARINGIIEKSNLSMDRDNLPSVLKLLEELYDDTSKDSSKEITKETHDLLLHHINLNDVINNSVTNLDINKIVKYLYNLCTFFNTFVTQKNGKIIGSVDEKTGIGLCLITSIIIEKIFNILSFEPVDHI